MRDRLGTGRTASTLKDSAEGLPKGSTPVGKYHTHGALFYTGMEVLPTFAVYGSGRLSPDALSEAEANWRSRLAGLFDDAPIPFRSQNGGSYPDKHLLADHIAPEQTGLTAHIADAK